MNKLRQGINERISEFSGQLEEGRRIGCLHVVVKNLKTSREWGFGKGYVPASAFLFGLVGITVIERLKNQW